MFFPASIAKLFVENSVMFTVLILNINLFENKVV